ncbi:RNA-dependent DNA polymerase [Phytophthora megakarya]|uniref:RNA-dependent DNA polymerase n=1 Tax=Phytophthora megakarya TaxID=4795 RepID=A0A225ULN8_9STRA|nr:RNA-dependent DNA polymerase [Phytophthora megakarya]
MVAIANELIQGGEPPKSLLQGMIIPLKTKGDSQDAMDYRSIALLQTGYKVFAKVIATRVLEDTGGTIGDSQQGFVHGWQMLKPVMMMLAIL